MKVVVVTKRTKLVIYRTLIKPILTYASKTWTMTKSDEERLKCFESKILRPYLWRCTQGRIISQTL
ncbi:unnamed protein product [Diabrotica balteata]|uniref:Uncharacterized protein n=1 Tax=Diabrotica balteata TaxID=107213 RepID=A0A9N9TCP5_DIABA|nr:unnamed protein product [Diabrotica balteata]